MSMMQLLIPMSGQGKRFQASGYREPKPLVPVSGEPMITRVLAQYPADWPCTFVVARNHETQVVPVLKTLRPEAKIIVIDEHSQGPGHAAMAALRSGALPDDAPVLLSYCDFGMIWDAARFKSFVESTSCDACLISYKGFHPHYLGPTKYAYSRMEGDRVVEVREKGSFTDDRQSEFASAGAYYFKSARLLREAIEYQNSQKLVLNGESYTSLTTEALLQMRPSSDVRVFEIPYFHQWGTPEDLRIFEYWEKTYRALARMRGETRSVSQVLMPMAGLGSRFEKITPTPKPLIPVSGKPMFMRALESLPRAEIMTTVVTLDSVSDLIVQALTRNRVDAEVVSLAATPSGQALSTEAGLSSVRPDKEVLVSSCDHGIVLDPALWDRFRADPQCEAAIFTVRGFPGTRRRPEAYAYVERDPGSKDPCPPVRQVSVKKPLSDNPDRDSLLVGTFWFKSGAVLTQGIEDLKKRDDLRVRGELYLDSVFAILLAQGKTVREIPLEGYINWGDPDSLAEALYWEKNFSSVNP